MVLAAAQSWTRRIAVDAGISEQEQQEGVDDHHLIVARRFRHPLVGIGGGSLCDLPSGRRAGMRGAIEGVKRNRQSGHSEQGDARGRST